MIEPAALSLSIALLLSGVACLSLARARALRRPIVRAHDPVFEANILIAYGRTAEARSVLEQASRTPAVERRLAELA